jgi:HAE1 family hydrophobic/amphiphilic exporter-1
MNYTIIDRILKRPVTVTMLSLLVIGFGLFSLSRLKVTLYPAFDIPVVAISTGYRNVAPEDILRLLVEPIEAAVGSIDGVESIEGNARKGSAFIIMRLKPGTDARRVELDAREQLDRIRNTLPREATPPVIFQFDPEDQPIMRLIVQASNRGLDELRTDSDEVVEPLIEREDADAFLPVERVHRVGATVDQQAQQCRPHGWAPPKSSAASATAACSSWRSCSAAS